MPWKFSGDRPIYSQLVDMLDLRIVSGEYLPGSKLPSVRELADEAAVNPNTMQRAFTELERVGLVCSQRTAGRFVTDSEERISELRWEIAERETAGFLRSMLSLGYGEEEILSLITRAVSKLSKEENGNE